MATMNRLQHHQHRLLIYSTANAHIHFYSYLYFVVSAELIQHIHR
jgi:hypothetical protein